MAGKGADSTLSPDARHELGNTGIFVSPLGFGASPLGNEFGHVTVSCFSALYVWNGCFAFFEANG